MLANIPRAVLQPENKTYDTTDEWYVALAEMHIAQLIFQHNDLVTTEDDCRNKYVARQLFRRLAKDHRLSTFGFADDSWSAQSKSWSSQLSQAPKSWKPDIDEWTKVYDMRLQTWLSAMEKAENDIGRETLPFFLSTHMRESWETGRFWLNYAAKNSRAFDTVFWKYLDEKFFGPREEDISKNDLWKTRVRLLSEKERAAMEPFVEWKMEDKKTRKSVDWDPEVAKQRLSEVLFD
ncbi:hypothetical protein DL98DRAFT_550882 [Cadophora sp. DSE1049]|nr:hypothetical protein DL98DRAFT_550882 [Cadophora sp. DSE1049]